MIKNPIIYLRERSNGVYPAHITFTESQSEEWSEKSSSIKNIIRDFDNVSVRNLVVNDIDYRSKGGRAFKCTVDITHDNKDYTLLLDLRDHNLLMIMKNCNMKIGGIFDDNDFMFMPSSSGLCIVPKVDSCLEYRYFLEEKKKNELIKEVVAQKTKISKNKIKPFTFYKDIEGNVYAVIGLFSRYMAGSHKKNKIERDIFILKNFFEGNILNDLNEIKLENVSTVSKVDFYEEMNCFGKFTIEDFLDFYNENFSFNNKKFVELYFKTDDYNFFNNLRAVMNNQSFLLFIKNNNSINETNAVEKYFSSLSNNLNIKLENLFFNIQDTKSYYNKYLEIPCSKWGVDDYYKDDKSQLHSAEYHLMLLFADMRKFETIHTLYLKSKDVKENCFETKTLFFNVVFNNLMDILNQTTYELSLYKAKSSYGAEYLSNAKIQFLHKRDKSMIFDYSTTYQGSYDNILPYHEFNIKELIECVKNNELNWMILECFRTSRY